MVDKGPWNIAGKKYSITITAYTIFRPQSDTKSGAHTTLINDKTLENGLNESIK